VRREEHVARTGEIGYTYTILVGKCEGKRPLGRHKRRWENNTTVNLTEIVSEGEDVI